MAETEFPDYDVPEGALADGADRTESRSATETTEVPPKETTEEPPAPVTEGKEPQPRSTPTEPLSDDTVPRYRLDEVREQERKAAAERDRFKAEAEDLRRQMAGMRSAPPREPARPTEPAAPLTDEEKKTAALRAGLFQVVPELAKLPDLIKRLEDAGRWDEAAEATGAWMAAEKTFYERHTDTQLGRLHDMAASAVLGTGKVAADLPEMMRGALDNAFGRWVFADPQRRARYDALDGKLVDEFWPLFKASNIDPLRRSDSAAVMASVANRPRLPVGGSVTGAPPPAASPKPKVDPNKDEDAIYDESWDDVQALLGKG